MLQGSCMQSFIEAARLESCQKTEEFKKKTGKKKRGILNPFRQKLKVQ